MTKPNESKTKCILGLAPSSRGIGYAVMVDGNVLHECGVKNVKSGDKNDRTLSHLGDLIERHKPDILVLEKKGQESRSERIRELHRAIVELAESGKIEARLLSRAQVNVHLLKNEDGTRHQIAQHVSAKYSELECRLPQKRRFYNSEAYQMDIFKAVALASTVSNARH